MVILAVFVRFEAKMIIEIPLIQLAAEAAMSHVDLPRLKHTRGAQLEIKNITGYEFAYLQLTLRTFCDVDTSTETRSI